MSDAIPIRPVRELGDALLRVEKPARYTGGEYGLLSHVDAPFQTAIAFPDLYEIGMSNQALRILYNRLNELPGLSCDRAFAPAPDFEALLREKSMPLYTLDTGLPLKALDLLLFTLGYELGITSVLTMLDLGGIPIRREERGEDMPLVIMGGPCVSNPLPYARFIDAFWIGEAEAGFFELTEKLAHLKAEGKTREDLRAALTEHPSIWTAEKKEARRAIDLGFSTRPAKASVFPVPGMKAVQHHGAVEIMRGCPNGCRFCHAGYWYRPMRQKSAEVIREETEEFVRKGGYREISLSSLSSGDYQYLDSLVDSLNRSFSPDHVSFQLPSLRVSSFSLPLLEKISTVRKSGLTFAVETPEASWQLAINKEVSLDSIVTILQGARKNGWRGAKFYFMIGLPPSYADTNTAAPDPHHEAEAIVSFILEAGRRTGIHFNINIGLFVPKPHTPYERMPQLGIEKAREQLEYIRSRLKPRGHKVSLPDPFVSLIEGILSRGDYATAGIIEEAWKKGCRLDAWQDEMKKDLWQEVLTQHPAQVSRILEGWKGGEGDQEEQLPWDLIKTGVGKGYLSHEYARSQEPGITLPCIENCTHPCGICNNDTTIVQNTAQDKPDGIGSESAAAPKEAPGFRSGGKADLGTMRILFSFKKTGAAVYHAHLSVLEIFSMAFMRAGIPVFYSEGFNPLPRLEVVAPLSLGLAAKAEMAAIDTGSFMDALDFMDRLNRSLPQGFTVTHAENYYIPPGAKKHSLSSLLWGFEYRTSAEAAAIRVSKEQEKAFRVETPAGLERLAVLAQVPKGGDNGVSSQGEPYFELYRGLYPGRQNIHYE